MTALSRGGVQPRHNYQRYLYLALVLVAIYVIVPQLGIFQHSLSLAQRAQPKFVLVALAASLVSYLFAALTYYLLAIKPLRYRPTLLIQVASMFTNRLLPAGLGSMGANFLYLRQAGHNSSQAVSVVGLNNVLGLLGHAWLVGLLLVLVPSARQAIPAGHVAANTVIMIVAVTVGLLLTLTLAPKLRQRLAGGATAVAGNVWRYRRRPGRLLAALTSSTALTISNLMCLWFSALAVGVHVGLVAILLVFTFGIALGSVAPTPGGLGGVEAGLVAGLIAYHVPANQALAAVLIFRLINYWFSFLLGAGAFVLAQRRGYLQKTA